MTALLQTGGSTPFYTAPELLQGEGQPSAASDLWSLGCILYECVAGKPPFVSTSISSLAALMQSSDPAPLVGRGYLSHMCKSVYGIGTVGPLGAGMVCAWARCEVGPGLGCHRCHCCMSTT